MKCIRILLIVSSLACFDALGQSQLPPPSALASLSSPTTHAGVVPRQDLVAMGTINGAYVNAGMVLYPFKCDPQGNLYLRNVIDGVPAIHKLNSSGKQIALFQPDLATPDFKVVLGEHFSIGKEGYVYQLVEPREVRRLHVFIYRPDGSLKSYIKLETGFPWAPAQVAAFASGSLLVTGYEYDHDPKNPVKWPFTGVFGPDGSLLKEVKLEDDGMIHDMAATGDSRVTSPEAPGVNRAIEQVAMEAASDGNIYLMRRLAPAILYAISSDGRVVRRFTVDAGQPDYLPESMHIAGDRIAVQFDHPQNGDQLIKVVDLEGHELATYHVDRESTLGFALSCYTSNPERFTFLGDTDDQKLTLTVGGPR